MGVSLKKGQKISLTKTDEQLNSILIGLGWDPVKQASSKGFFGKLLGSSSSPSATVDCDASVILLDENDKLSSKKNLIYYGNLQNTNKSVHHLGDNLTGAGDGDDEQINISLANIPSNVHKLIFVVNIYACSKRNQDFGMIENAYIRIENSSTRQEIARFNLSNEYAGFTSLVVGELYRHNTEWKFNALGHGDHSINIEQLLKKLSK